MNRLLYLAGVTLLCLTACSSPGMQTTIGYLQITPDPVLDVAREGVFQALADSGFVVGQNLSVIDYNAQGDLSLLANMLQSFQARQVDVIVTNGTPCMSAAAQMVRDIPVVFTVSFGPEQIGLNTTPEHLYGVYDSLLVDELIDLILECIPTVQTVGLPFNNSEPNAEYSARVVREGLEKRGLQVLTTAVNSPNDIMMAGQFLCDREVDVILVAADNTTYLGLNTLSKIATTHKIPLFVTDPIQAGKGAAIGYGVDYHKWGYQSGQMAVGILNGRKPNQPLSIIRDYELIINEKACLEQGLSVPESVRERANRVLQ